VKGRVCQGTVAGLPRGPRSTEEKEKWLWQSCVSPKQAKDASTLRLLPMEGCCEMGRTAAYALPLRPGARALLLRSWTFFCAALQLQQRCSREDARCLFCCCFQQRRRRSKVLCNAMTRGGSFSFASHPDGKIQATTLVTLETAIQWNLEDTLVRYTTTLYRHALLRHPRASAVRTEQ
jgi:hypothetical protein